MYQMTESEERFAEILWTHGPMTSRELVARCQETLNWKKSTTYTVLKKLCTMGLFRNVDAQVSILVDRAAYEAGRSVQFVEETFEGSLPRFLTAFISGRRISREQAEQLKALIEAHEEDLL